MSLNLLWRVLEETRFDDPVEKLMLVLLADSSTPEGEVLFDPPKLAAQCCTTLPDLWARLHELEARGWIRHDAPLAQKMLCQLDPHNVGYAFWLMNAEKIEAELPHGENSTEAQCSVGPSSSAETRNSVKNMPFPQVGKKSRRRNK